jgi:type I restriction enzyme S subunit
MKPSSPKVQLGEVLRQIERSEPVAAGRMYRLLGVRWYGQGLFVREEKIGVNIAATRLYSVQPGDFVYNRLFAWKGSFAVAGPEASGAYVSNEFPCFVTDPARVDPYFLLWFFRQERTWTEVLGLSTGATPTSRNRLNESAFLAMEILLPSLAEQRRVVGRIDELATQINEARTLRHETAPEAEALLVTRVGYRLARIANEFAMREFGSFCPHVTSGPRNWGGHYSDHGHRFYRAQDIGPKGQVLEDSKVFVVPPTGEQGRSASLKRGDLMLVITGATVGRVSVFRDGLEPGLVSQHVAICRLPANEVDPEFALWGLRSLQGPAARSMLRSRQARSELVERPSAQASVPSASRATSHRGRTRRAPGKRRRLEPCTNGNRCRA